MASSERATARKEGEGEFRYALRRLNAVKHGILSRHTVLPWEDAGEYEELLAALAEEHRPEGPTEAHLVEELAGVIWRKRRLRLAEAALAGEGLREGAARAKQAVRAVFYPDSAQHAAGAVEAAVVADPEAAAAERAALMRARDGVRRALAVLRAGAPNAYARALTALDQATRDWWRQALTAVSEDEAADDEAPALEDEPAPRYSADAAGLRAFLEGAVAARHEAHFTELLARPAIRALSLGPAHDPARLASLIRYEAHLDRKLERTLAMLIRLRELRRAAPAAGR